MREQLGERAVLVDDVSRVGFLTAVWASGGVALLGLMVMGFHDGARRLLVDHGHVVVPFVLGVYGSSYVWGRLFLWKNVRHNIFLSMLMAFVVSELVLGTGALCGSVGYAIRDMIVRGESLSEVLYQGACGTMALVTYGMMYTLPLSVGLGTTVRVWAHRKAQQSL